MKILHIAEFSTEEGSNKTTTLPLDGRKGLLYKIVTNTYTSAIFNTDMQSVPITMNHADRSPSNVKVTINAEDIEIFQYYQQAERGVIYTLCNDDWADSSELKAVYVDSTLIDLVKLTTGAEENVVPSQSNNSVVLRMNNENHGVLYTDTINTIDGKSYLFPIKWEPVFNTVNDVKVYSHHTATVARVITVYKAE